MKKTLQQTSDNNLELRAVLDNQDAIAAAQAAVLVLEESLAECERGIEVARSRRPSDARLNHELESLRAAVALNEVTAAEAQAREKDIANQLADLAQATAPVDEEITRLEGTRKGLQRRLGDKQAEYAALAERTPALLRMFFQAEAERVCGDYVAAVAKTTEALLQLVALDRLMKRFAGTRGSFLGFRWDEAYFPAINLEPCAGVGYQKTWPGVLFSMRHALYGNDLREAEVREIARLHDLGIPLE